MPVSDFSTVCTKELLYVENAFGIINRIFKASLLKKKKHPEA